jgi:GNAT superfamily N-acetyltransferase
MAVDIRPVSGRDDLERWVAVHNRVRRDDPATTDAKALVRALQTERADLLAFVDGVPVGTAVLSGDAESVDSGPYLQVSVLPAYRGRGIGDALLRAASQGARRFGRTGLSCDVDAWRGRGIGRALVGARVARARQTRAGSLIAWLPVNTAPSHVFRSVGFEQVRSAVELRGPLLP